MAIRILGDINQKKLEILQVNHDHVLCKTLAKKAIRQVEDHFNSALGLDSKGPIESNELVEVYLVVIEG